MFPPKERQKNVLVEEMFAVAVTKLPKEVAEATTLDTFVSRASTL